jgi:hypothetical protein
MRSRLQKAQDFVLSQCAQLLSTPGAKVKGFICKRIGLALLAVNIQTGTSIAFRRAVVAAAIASLRQPFEST